MQQLLISEWNNLFGNKPAVDFLQNILLEYLPTCRWFGGKSRAIQNIEIHKQVRVETQDYCTYCCIVQCNYDDGLYEWYSLPITITNDETLPNILQLESLFLVDALQMETFRKIIYSSIFSNSKIHEISGSKSKQTVLDEPQNVQSKILKVEQSNTSIIYNNKYFFKWFRKIDLGINPDLETIKYLTEKTTFKNIPLYVGHVTWAFNNDEALLGMMQNAVPNNGDAWVYICDELKSSYKNLLVDSTKSEINLSTYFIEKISLLGKRTAELHNALCNENDDEFMPEKFDINYQNWILECIEKLIDAKFNLLQENLYKLTLETKTKADKVLEAKQKLINYFKTKLETPLQANKIRIHGDYHLGQVLYSNNDFVILDFEGEPDKPHAMRRIKYTSLRDVAGMLRSFHYATYAVLYQNFNEKEQQQLTDFAINWYNKVYKIYLDSYIQNANEIALPQNSTTEILLQLYIAEKAIYEMGYEINNRPAWLNIPLQNLFELVSSL